MRQSAIRNLMLLIATAMFATSATVTQAEAKTHKNSHVRKQMIRPIYGRRFPQPDQAWRAPAVSQPEDVCPGAARSFDCKIWPPPIYDDPDRKGSSSDGS